MELVLLSLPTYKYFVDFYCKPYLHDMKIDEE